MTATTLGVGGVLAARLGLCRPAPALAVAAVVTAGGLTLAIGHSGWLTIAGQVVRVALLTARTSVVAVAG